MSYVSFDRAIGLVACTGQGVLLAKSDIDSAFCLLLVDPSCFYLLGYKLSDQIDVDLCLPMGCSISCRYFEMFSSFLEWVVYFETSSNSVTHDLDDFLFVGSAESGVFNMLCYFMFFFVAAVLGPKISLGSPVNSWWQ